jgi:NAD-reducing hydrogenase large subunit
LFHHYRVDKDGLLKKIDLLIATGQNALAMNRTVTQIAKHYVKSAQIAEPILNRIEAGIRAFDPCLSCSTHAMGQMPLVVELRREDGTLLQKVQRD